MRSWHLPDGHLPLICAIYSSLKYFNVDRIGFGADFPNPHKLPFFVQLARYSNSSRSFKVPFPVVILVRISSILFVPILQKVHFPQDSFCVNERKKRAISTMQSSSSRTTSPPEPIMAPTSSN